MTKNVGIELAKKRMKAMGIRFAEGRSVAAAKLHSIAVRDGWKVEQKGTDLNILKSYKVPITELYTPEGEEEYLVHSSKSEAIRITSGKTPSGKVFEIEDDMDENAGILGKLGPGLLPSLLKPPRGTLCRPSWKTLRKTWRA